MWRMTMMQINILEQSCDCYNCERRTKYAGWYKTFRCTPEEQEMLRKDDLVKLPCLKQ